MKIVRSFQARNHLVCGVATRMVSKEYGAFWSFLYKDQVINSATKSVMNIKDFTNSEGWVME